MSRPEDTRALVETRRQAEERYANSARGMRQTAAELRRSAIEMLDSNDRDMMLRIATGYEHRARTVERRSA